MFKGFNNQRYAKFKIMLDENGNKTKKRISSGTFSLEDISK